MFKNVYLISSVGSALLASNAFWFQSIFDDNINDYAPESINTSINPEPFVKDYSKKEVNLPAGGFYVTPNESSKRYYLIKPYEKLDDFSLKFKETAKGYLSFNKEDIGISFFKKPAWENDSKKDEYGEKENKSNVLSLFNLGLNEIKVKQLLLSLSIRRDWKPWYTDFLSDILRPSSLDDLKDLKIKYFKDFESLKKYVQEKVKSCSGEKRSCVANKEELRIIDQDKMSFFDPNN